MSQVTEMELQNTTMDSAMQFVGQICETNKQGEPIGLGELGKVVSVAMLLKEDLEIQSEFMKAVQYLCQRESDLKDCMIGFGEEKVALVNDGQIEKAKEILPRILTAIETMSRCIDLMNT